LQKELGMLKRLTTEAVVIALLGAVVAVWALLGT
jgi:hypothetical protein